MKIIDNAGRVKAVSERDAKVLFKLGKARPYKAPKAQTENVPEFQDEHEELIEALAQYGIIRDRRYSVERLREELEEARGYNTRQMKAD